MKVSAFKGPRFAGFLVAVEKTTVPQAHSIELILVATKTRQLPSKGAVTQVFSYGPFSGYDIPGLPVVPPLSTPLSVITEKLIRAHVISNLTQTGLCFNSQQGEPGFFLGPGAIRITELVSISAAVKFPLKGVVIRHLQVKGMVIPPRFLAEPNP